jgi:hypothetical protein
VAHDSLYLTRSGDGGAGGRPTCREDPSFLYDLAEGSIARGRAWQEANPDAGVRPASCVCTVAACSLPHPAPHWRLTPGSALTRCRCQSRSSPARAGGWCTSPTTACLRTWTARRGECSQPRDRERERERAERAERANTRCSSHGGEMLTEMSGGALDQMDAVRVCGECGGLCGGEAAV